MICKPKPHVKNDKNGKYSLGGYLLNDEMFTDEIILENYELKERSKIQSSNILYEVVDNLNSVGFKINTNLSVYEHTWLPFN